MSIILLLTSFFFSCTRNEQPIDNLPIAFQKINKNEHAMSGTYPDSTVLVVKVPKERALSMPKKFIMGSNLDGIPVFKLQKTDSMFIADDMLKDLAAKNQESSKISNILLLIGGFVIVLGLLVFVIRKRKQSKIEKQLMPEVSMEQPQSEIPVEIFENIDTEVDSSNAIEVPTAENIELYAKLITYYQNEKPYLDSNLKAIDVAKALNISPRTITAILKANGFNGFNNFNNKYRVDEVIRQFEDPNNKSIKMEVISSKAGFGNRQTFYIAFEEFTGVNPGFYRSELLK